MDNIGQILFNTLLDSWRNGYSISSEEFIRTRLEADLKNYDDINQDVLSFYSYIVDNIMITYTSDIDDPTNDFSRCVDEIIQKAWDFTMLILEIESPNLADKFKDNPKYKIMIDNSEAAQRIIACMKTYINISRILNTETTVANDIIVFNGIRAVADIINKSTNIVVGTNGIALDVGSTMLLFVIHQNPSVDHVQELYTTILSLFLVYMYNHLNLLPRICRLNIGDYLKKYYEYGTIDADTKLNIYDYLYFQPIVKGKNPVLQLIIKLDHFININTVFAYKHKLTPESVSQTVIDYLEYLKSSFRFQTMYRNGISIMDDELIELRNMYHEELFTVIYDIVSNNIHSCIPEEYIKPPRMIANEVDFYTVALGTVYNIMKIGGIYGKNF